MASMTALLAALPVVGEVSNTTLLCTAVALVLAYFFVFGKLRPRSIKYPRSTFPAVKGKKVRHRARCARARGLLAASPPPPPTPEPAPYRRVCATA